MFWKRSSEKKEEKKKVKLKQVYGGAWGHLVSEHHIVVDTLVKWRCLDQPGEVDGRPVTLLRIFDPATAQQKGIPIEGWTTFDEHPELVLFEGYLRRDNTAWLERRNQ